MSLLEQYERQATILRRRGNVITDYDVRRDMQLIASEPVDNWKTVQNRLAQSGDPTALSGGYAGTEVTPNVANLATVTATATEAALWPTATWTPIAANPQCPKAYRLFAFGALTTAATPGTVLFNFRFGQIVTSPLLVATVAAAQTASQTTANWVLRGDIVIYRGGAATTGLAVGTFNYRQGTATTVASASMPVMDQIAGTVNAGLSVVTDGSVAAGLWAGVIAATSTTNTFIPQAVIWCSWN